MNIGFQAHGFAGWSSWFTGYNTDELQEESAALDAQLTAINEQAKATGTITDDEYQQTVAHIAQQIAATKAIPHDVNAAWVAGALEGYRADLAVLEGIPKYAGRITGDVLGAITRGVTGGVGSIGAGFFGNLPWWLWAGGAVALFVYFGGAGYVARRARARLSQ